MGTTHQRSSRRMANRPQVEHPNIGLIVDSFHTPARKIDVNSIRSIPKDRIFIVQLADAPLIEVGVLYWSRHFRNMPGEGDPPFINFMSAVADTDYGWGKLFTMSPSRRSPIHGEAGAAAWAVLAHFPAQQRRWNCGG